MPTCEWFEKLRVCGEAIKRAAQAEDFHKVTNAPIAFSKHGELDHDSRTRAISPNRSTTIPRERAMSCLGHCAPIVPAVFSLLLAFLAPAVASAVATFPIDDDVVVAADKRLPSHLARFVGAWSGDCWNGTLPNLLVVERVADDGTADVVYAWGDSVDGKMKGGCTRMQAHVVDNRLTLAPPRGGPHIDYEWTRDGALLGRYAGKSGEPSYVLLTRVEGIDAATIKSHASIGRHRWEDIRIPEHSAVGPTAGHLLMLQAMFYRSPLTGRRPLVIFSHGSSGGGAISRADFPRIMDGALPRIFLALGCNVIEPLRKGFGASEGSAFEETKAAGVADQVRLDSALEDLDATVRFMATQPFVDPKRMVLVGQSRGGILSVVYAGTNPARIAGVINFAGGWWGERTARAEFNVTQFADAGRTAKAPMLWLYAHNDSYYAPAFIQRCFDAYEGNGGKAELIEYADVPGEGHFLVNWPDQWRAKAEAFVASLGVEK